MWMLKSGTLFVQLEHSLIYPPKSCTSYAVAVFKAYNGCVKTCVAQSVRYTFNEPNVFCGAMLGTAFNGVFAPGVNATSAPFQCAYNLHFLSNVRTVKAHAGAVKATANSKGIPWRTHTTEDALAVERHAALQIGIFSDPGLHNFW
ncbi:hypothetical protein CPB85DRAFT_1254196 [Mucidula mucida]|nr:hypothetical protein CPB85DRAFT_1254196 [Mucidula mucida]